MKRNILMIASGSFLALNAIPAVAQPSYPSAESQTSSELPANNKHKVTVPSKTETKRSDNTSSRTPQAPNASSQTIDPSYNNTGSDKITTDYSKTDHNGKPVKKSVEPEIN